MHCSTLSQQWQRTKAPSRVFSFCSTSSSLPARLPAVPESTKVKLFTRAPMSASSSAVLRPASMRDAMKEDDVAWSAAGQQRSMAVGRTWCKAPRKVAMQSTLNPAYSYRTAQCRQRLLQEGVMDNDESLNLDYFICQRLEARA